MWQIPRNFSVRLSVKLSDYHRGWIDMGHREMRLSLGRLVLRLLVIVVFLTILSGMACADGILIPIRPEAPNFAIKYHRVEVKIEDRVATTSIDQVFVNRSGRQQEAIYVFPLPHGAAVREFTLYDQGQPLHAELINREKARSIYESIVAKRRDPGLLEYVGRDIYRVSVFPIPAGETKRIQLKYTELLPFDTGVVSYIYPLSTEKFSSMPIEEVKVQVKIDSKAPLSSIYSPTHDVKVDRPDAHSAIVTFEEHGTRPSTDLVLNYSVSQEDVGTSILTYKEPDEDGFFMLMGAPAIRLADKTVQPKSVIFVLDRSGSMSGEKIDQVKGALTYCLNSLNQKDRFRVVTFNSSVTTHGEGRRLMSATRENVKEALAGVDEIRAEGGTDINSALKTALEMAATEERKCYIVFLTDGQPTVGETNTDDIQKNIAKLQAQGKTKVGRIFVFGAGYDVNTHFLEKLAQDNGGVADYVRPSENIEVKVSRLFAKVAQPVMTDVTLDIKGIETYDIFPKEMPDLFTGSQLLVFGRYRAGKGSEAQVSLSGNTGSARKQYETTVRFAASKQDQHSFIAPLWASRKIALLLDEIMLRGKNDELVDEIIALSTRYGILTEYTAFLATEGDQLAAPGVRRRALDNLSSAKSEVAGSWATSQRQNSQLLRDNISLSKQNTQYDAEGNITQFQQVQTRNNQAFFNRSGRWEDARYRKGVQKVVQVKAFSDAYFQITRRAPELNQYLSLGKDVTVVTNNQAIEIGDVGKESFTTAELDTLLGKQSKIAPEDTHSMNTLGDGQHLTFSGNLLPGIGVILLVGCFAVVLHYKKQ
jgi:Ca-activated chloride channel homolog